MCSIALEKGKQFCNFEPLHNHPSWHQCKFYSSHLCCCSNNTLRTSLLKPTAMDNVATMSKWKRNLAFGEQTCCHPPVSNTVNPRKMSPRPRAIRPRSRYIPPPPGTTDYRYFCHSYWRGVTSLINDVPSFSDGLGLTDEYKVSVAHEFCFFSTSGVTRFEMMTRVGANIDDEIYFN